jgi:hypothetical protein
MIYGGSYPSPPRIELLPEGRVFKLLEPFTYIDPRGVEWVAPAGTLADGASIPRIFWSILGGPLEGKYRDASIIHDFYCSTRHKPWREVHRMFLDAMLTSGVEDALALRMYAAVRAAGPRWTDMDVHNATILGSHSKLRDRASVPEGIAPVTGGYRYRMEEKDIYWITAIVASDFSVNDPSFLAYIDHYLDRQIEVRSPAVEIDHRGSQDA